MTMARVLFLWFCMGEAIAGYLSVSMTAPVQCGVSYVSWSGDSGPWHLLLTPTDFVQHGYNLWVPSIPTNTSTSNYSVPINLPVGTSFLLTMWGASGIAFAGTTDILTVASSKDSSCFLSDAVILALYTFSFNISDTSDGYPPQCSNLSMSWPTSLESNVTSGGGGSSRRAPVSAADLFPRVQAASSSPGSMIERDLHSARSSAPDDALLLLRDAPQLAQLDQSSSEHSNGNTTKPPTMFGIIPLGNSFSIPITYNRASKWAQSLPASSLSDTPTTYTSQGITHLNWTMDLAKGTRFILVAGIGSDMQWASGGSSTMLTVGQGTTGCTGSEVTSGVAKPSVTGSSTASASPSPESDSGASSTSSTTSGDQGDGVSPAVKTALACVISVIGTLLLVGIWFFLRRVRRRRAEAGAAAPYPIGISKSTRSLDGRQSPETPLDLFAPRDGRDPRGPREIRDDHRALRPILTESQGGGSSEAVSPAGSDPFGDRAGTGVGPIGPEPGSDRRAMGFFPSRRATMDDSSPSASPIRDRDRYQDELIRGDAPMGRQSSREALLHGSSRLSSPLDAGGMGSYGMGTLPTVSTHRPLRLHDRSMGIPDENDIDGEEEVEDDDNDVPELKRDTLAYLGEQPGSSDSAAGGAALRDPRSRTPDVLGPSRRRRRDEAETQYVVHRDAGRVVSGPPPERRVLELPPRYEELDWEDGPEERLEHH